MDAEDLWVESYQGEVLGEVLFSALAEKQQDPQRRHQLEVLTKLERSTKELAEPVLEARGLERGDTETTIAGAIALAESLGNTSWPDFLASFGPITTQFLAKYRALVALAATPAERAVAEAYVAHEEALACFARRALGQEDGEPLAPIEALPHVAALA